MDEALEAALQQEQAYADRVYTRLDELRTQSRARLDQTRRQGPTGSPQNRSERDSFAAMYEDRLRQLNSVEERLIFGRLDATDGSTRYLGKLGILDEDLHPLLVDWRADVVRPFYTATAASPEGVLRRRHLLTRLRKVTSVEDEVVDHAAFESSSLAALPIQGEGALMAALSAHRTGRMADVVATIQAEQDEIVRADSAGVLVVQGGPGTGKTAVALHRAAYVLYRDRERLRRSGVLVIGPSRTFLRYIEKVLPALGETGVVYTTMAQLLPGVQVNRTEAPEVAALKGDVRWAEILRRAVQSRQRVLPEQQLRVGSVTITLRQRDVREAISRARRSSPTHNGGRVTFVRHMLTRLGEQYAQALGDRGIDDASGRMDDVRSSDAVKLALNLCWLPWSAGDFLDDLLAKEHRLVEAAPDLSDSERKGLLRPRRGGWSVADVPLLDELEELLGPISEAFGEKDTEGQAANVESAAAALENTSTGWMVSAETLAQRFEATPARLSAAEYALTDRTWTYGHIVVDEAQELTPMQWRAVLRRNPSRSMTLVGDIAQAAAPGSTRAWEARLNEVFGDRWRMHTLSVNYRTPRSIMDLATVVATECDPTTPPAALISPRELPDAITLEHTETLGGSLAAWIHQRATSGGTTAVICTPQRHEALQDELGIHTTDSSASSVVVLTPDLAKGLEFDHVIVVEPGEIMRGQRGAADIYVTLTRPTHSLTIVHSSGLTPAFDLVRATATPLPGVES